MDKFIGLRVSLSTGEAGVLEGSFGQSGKVRVRIPEGVREATQSILKAARAKEKPAGEEAPSDPITISLKFKRYIFDAERKMIQ